MVRTAVSASSLRVGEYGLGGRHSVSGVTTALFGATGFLGRYVCSAMGKIGTRVRAGNRGCEMETRHLKVSFDHGQFHAPFYSARDDASIGEVIGKSSVVINMVGKYHETRHVVPTRRTHGDWKTLSNVNYSFDEVYCEIPRRLARAAKKAGARSFVHVSGMHAAHAGGGDAAYSTPLLGFGPSVAVAASASAEAKARGEAAVREEFPDAIIVRPCAMFGHEDRLLNWFASMANMPGGVVPLVGGDSVVQPVHVADVAAVLNKLSLNPGPYAGKTIELGGPAEYTRRELAEFTFDITDQKPRVLELPAELAQLASYVPTRFPNPLWTEDDVALDQRDDVVAPDTDALTFQDFGVVPTPIEKIAFAYLHRYREGGHFIIAQGFHGS